MKQEQVEKGQKLLSEIYDIKAQIKDAPKGYKDLPNVLGDVLEVNIYTSLLSDDNCHLTMTKETIMNEAEKVLIVLNAKLAKLEKEFEAL